MILAPATKGSIAMLKRRKTELLKVLERPDLPLHNNASEQDIREFVTKRKISGSTRSESGRRCRDTFASLKKTCRKLGISFWEYLILLANVLQSILHQVLLIAKVRISHCCSTISFRQDYFRQQYQYLKDRVSGTNLIPTLGILIAQKASLSQATLAENSSLSSALRFRGE